MRPNPSRRLILVSTAVVAACVFTGAPARAAPPAEDTHGGEEEVSEKEIARSVELAGLVFPVFDEDFKLKNYIFVNARFVVASGKDTWKFREQAHFMRDAVLREAHRKSFHKDGNFAMLDVERAAKLCLKAVNEAVGEEAFASVTFSEVNSQSGDLFAGLTLTFFSAGQLLWKPANRAEQLLKDADLATTGWRHAGIVFNHAAVLEVVVEYIGDDIVLVKLDGDDLAVDDLGIIEGLVLAR